MPLEDRRNRTGSVTTPNTTLVSDGAGGSKPSGDPTVIAASLKYNRWNYRLRDREAKATEYGLGLDEQLISGECEYVAGILRGMTLTESGTNKKFRILTAEPMRMGGMAGANSHMSLLLVEIV